MWRMGGEGIENKKEEEDCERKKRNKGKKT
jgi:hypothetical protein